MDDTLAEQNTTEELFTVHEVALRLRLDDTTIRRYIIDGVLPAITLPHAGKRRIYRIRKSTIDQLLKVENTAT